MPQYQGVWTLPVAARLQSTQQWATDPLYRNTTLLLQADNAANGAQNNTFLDSSSNNFTITRNGNTTQGTFTPFSQSPGWWSNYFGGSQSINPAASTDFQLAGDFTIEAWVYTPSTVDASVFVQQSSTNYFALNVTAGTNINVYLNNPSANFTVTDRVPATNTWNHIALVRSGSGSGNLKIYLNGIASSTTATNTSTLGYNAAFYIGALGTQSGGSFNGYISNLRVVSGTALYTTNFTPSPIPLTAVTNTKLLTCQSNAFIDTNTQVTAKTITVNGTPSVQAFSPFAPQYQYTPSVTGGSGYFDGTGDYLSIADNTAFQFGSGDFTIEAWVYRTATSGGAQQIIGSHEDGLAASFLLYISSANKLTMAVNNSIQAVSAGSVPVSAWTHVAGVRNGNTIFVYVNGIQDGSVAFSTSVNSNAYPITIAADQNGDESFYSGYIANLRIVKGTAVYTSNFTPPTTPLTNITNTSLLCNFTNAGIYDGTLKNNLETVGNAQVSTSVVKYGTGSMYFDGANDALTLPNSPVLQLGSADFTCEFWAYRLATANMTWVFLNGNSSNYAALRLDTDTSGNIFLLMSTSGSTWAINTSGSAVLPLSTWTHIAAVRFGGTMRLYVNGVALISTTISGSLIAGTSQQVGANFGATQVVNGYLDDLRITNGIARYTANFTPPTVALPRQ